MMVVKHHNLTKKQIEALEKEQNEYQRNFVKEVVKNPPTRVKRIAYKISNACFSRDRTELRNLNSKMSQFGFKFNERGWEKLTIKPKGKRELNSLAKFCKENKLNIKSEEVYV